MERLTSKEINRRKTREKAKQEKKRKERKERGRTYGQIIQKN